MLLSFRIVLHNYIFLIYLIHRHLHHHDYLTELKHISRMKQIILLLKVLLINCFLFCFVFLRCHCEMTTLEKIYTHYTLNHFTVISYITVVAYQLQLMIVQLKGLSDHFAFFSMSAPYVTTK